MEEVSKNARQLIQPGKESLWYKSYSVMKYVQSVACFVLAEEQRYLKACSSSLRGYWSLNFLAWRKVSVTERENKRGPPLKCSCLVNLKDDILFMYQSPL